MHKCLLLIALLPGVPQGYSQSSSTASGSNLDAGRSSGSIRLDGRLDDAAWSNAISVAELAQQSPKPRQQTPYKTVVRALVIRDNIYLGFDCIDPDPSRIAVHTMRRDGDVEGDDTVAVVLDTHGDRRTGYLFRINAAGARVDGLVAGLKEPSLDWDGIWDARTARSDTGWSAELVIPSQTLSFTRGLSNWGANFERAVPRDRTVLRWTSPTLDSFLYDFSRAGTMSGVGELQQGVGLEVSPYVVGRMRDFFGQSARAWQSAPGVDITYRITSQMAAVFTANTDFAETEVDSRQLNLTRFPLFFPERRTFFLEGANQYEFGLGLGETFIPFFSRRVGLFEGHQIPLDAGVKLNGRAGPWNIGILNVQTRDTVPAGADRIVPGANLFAGRVSYDVTSRLRLGGILTNGNPDGIHRNTFAGFDGVWRTSKFLGDKNLFIGGWTAFSAGDVRDGNRTGWGFRLDYPNDLWNCFTSLNQFGEALDPALGFLPRPGTRRFDATCDFQPRPSKTGPFHWVRQQTMEHRFYRVTNFRGRVESWQFHWAPVDIEMESGDEFEFNWVPSYEYLPFPFEIATGVTLPAGSYRFDRFRFEFESSRHRRWEFGATTWFGTFYNGRLFQQQNYLRFTTRTGSWQAGVSSEQNFGDVAQGKFIQRLYQLNFAYAFNPNLALTSFLQYDSESQNVGNNMRLRWIVRPGNDLFVVWNRSWRRLILNREDLSLIPEAELVAIKLRWTFRR
jgi:hypothetical protein